MNADAKLDALLGRDLSVALDHSGLDFDRAAHGVNHAPELDEEAVAGLLDHPAVIGLDRGIDQIAAQRPEPRQRAILIRPGKSAIADDIGRQDGGKLPGLGHSSGIPALRRPSKSRSL